jgi:hypothetical protein
MKIRRSFETNSSSSHSLVLDFNLDEDGAVDTICDFADFGTINEDGFLEVRALTVEFGWQWEVWSDPGTKVAYMLLDGFSQHRMQLILHSNLSSMYPQIKGIILPNIEDGHIDHQSVGRTGMIAGAPDDIVWKFISGNSAIRGGNDNSDGPWERDEDDDF